MGWPLSALLVGSLLYVMLRALQWNKRRTQELVASSRGAAAGQAVSR